MYRAEVFVTLKEVVNDPAGLTIRGGLHALGFESVKDVRAGKYLVITVDEPAEDHARARGEDMAHQLLAKAVIEDFLTERPTEPAQQSPPPSRRGAQAPA